MFSVKEGDRDSGCCFPAQTHCQEAFKVIVQATSVQAIAVSANIDVRVGDWRFGNLPPITSGAFL